MTKINVFTTFGKLCGFRLWVRANRACCKSDFARVVHDRLCEFLDYMIATLRSDIGSEVITMRHTRISYPNKAIGSSGAMFEEMWLHQRAISLLDPIETTVTDEGGIMRPAELPYTLVTGAELEGLWKIIDEIEREVGVCFVVARVSQLKNDCM